MQIPNEIEPERSYAIDKIKESVLENGENRNERACAVPHRPVSSLDRVPRHGAHERRDQERPPIFQAQNPATTE